jgi:phosphohistidine phosphatase
MTRELLIMRHAKSDWQANAGTDFDRPLSKRGRKDAPLMGKWLKQQHLIPDYIISSPARRARQTTKRVVRELGLAPDSIHWEQRLYLAELSTLLEVLQAIPAASRRILVLGHNPGLDMLLTALCGPHLPLSLSGKLLATATVAHVALCDDDLHEAALQAASSLLAIARPRELAERNGA